MARSRANPAFRYLNPWSADPVVKPEFFTTDVRPTEYRGFQIFRRLPNSFELVKDGVCLTQRAGKNGPLNLVDALYGDRSAQPAWLIARAREVAKAHGVKLPHQAKAIAPANSAVA